jgi:adenine-specific DNA-methyltransferase
MSKYNHLVAKLREIFQIDKPDLDFGIYRIINARADEINDYLENRLKEAVKDGLQSGSAVNLAQLERELQETIKSCQALGIDPDTAPKVKELKQRLDEQSVGRNDHESAVYNHLLTFFSRYYINGDFISQRRYKGDTYAIPYSGEEVFLHWANKDQYYTKSGENFSNYSIQLDEERKVHFQLVVADTAKDNRKDNDEQRRFVLAENRVVVRHDEDGEEYEDEIVPIEERATDRGSELIIRFEYKVVGKKTKQVELNSQAIRQILTNKVVAENWPELRNIEPTKSNPERTLLEKHLHTYTEKNSADYFIHKDLGGFLKRELDFYIKNEVMHLDDVQNAEKFAEIEKNLRMIQCLRSIAHDLIAFLAQVEDFQKKLWLKKKFVVETNYCITLDRVPEDLYEEIAANEAQHDEWIKLYAIDEIEGDRAVTGYKGFLTVEFLKENRNLVLDTQFFDTTFKAKLIASIQDIDEQCDGILVDSENFQGVRSLQERYRNQISCVYIDPPYNTSENAFLYKNSYKHSSWLSMMANGLTITPSLMPSSGVIMGAIDDTEYSNLKYLLAQIFGEENNVGTIAVEVNPAGQNIRPNVPARSHDYFHIFAKDIEAISLIPRGLTSKERKQYKEKDNKGHFYWDNLRRRGGNSRPTDRPKQWYPLFIGKGVRVPKMEWSDATNEWILSEAPRIDETEVWPIDPKGERRIWRVNPDGARRRIAEGEISVIDKAGRREVSLKSREPKGKKPKTLWAKSKYSATTHGTKLLLNILGPGLHFSYPKSIHLTTDALRYWADKPALVLDFFAGSGTTGHAVINLNREDNGERKYILIEMGDYFDTVLIPRICKAVYSESWKDGKPIARETGVSHCFKYMRLESYEDTLNNLQLKRNRDLEEWLADNSQTSQSAREDYRLRYMLDIESRGSLLSVDDFNKPFDYTMKVAVDSAGASEVRKVDLVETFNYLIGLKVEHINARIQRGYVAVTGTLPSGETTFVLWRDMDVISYDDVEGIFEKLSISPQDTEFDIIYINGDHNLVTPFNKIVNGEGKIRTPKIRQIEPEFLELMFAMEDF